MTDQTRRTVDHPPDERATDTSTQAASGLSGGKGGADGPGVERNRALDDDILNRNAPRRETPRRYEQRADDDPVMPADHASLGTKI